MNLITIPPGLETESFVLEADALRHAPEILRKHWGAGPDAWIVADENTWTAAGEKLNAIFEEAGIGRCAPYLFPGRPILHATVEHVDELLAAFPENCVPVAVGGGTVNDLVKRASGVKGVRYCCVPTAPSVDGYTSYGAALNVDGLKKTLPCPAPLAIVADTAVLDSAPPEMFAAGYADLMAKNSGRSRLDRRRPSSEWSRSGRTSGSWYKRRSATIYPIRRMSGAFSWGWRRPDTPCSSTATPARPPARST